MKKRKKKMKTERKYTSVTVTDKAVRALKGGHPWVFADEILSIEGGYENGDIVDVLSTKNRYMGSGFINDNSKIRVRVISDNANDKFDEAFWERRVKYALEYRKTVMGKDFDCCRLIFGEADKFPGLTVDRFGSVLVTQCLSLGIDNIKDMLFPIIVRTLRNMGETIEVLYERNDVKIREKEGMEEYKAFYEGEGLLTDTDGKTVIEENGIKYNVDYINGQKTGFFLDQKYNRLAAAKIAPGKKVLDCFTHTGAFALNCAAAGAEMVTAVDVSKDAVEMTRKNAELNGFKNMDFVCADVFELLTEIAESGKKPYDYIILDPPAFTKSSATVKNAERGYKEINMKAMKILPRGGYLSTCSCSHFMKDELFRKMLRSSAADAGVELRQIEARQQSPDHPILWNVPETDYLKFYIFQIV